MVYKVTLDFSPVSLRIIPKLSRNLKGNGKMSANYVAHEYLGELVPSL